MWLTIHGDLLSPPPPPPSSSIKKFTDKCSEMEGSFIGQGPNHLKPEPKAIKDQQAPE
jgi:hypothetical protein